MTVRTSCSRRKARTPTGTLLSNRMRNAMTLGVCQHRFDTIRRYLKLLGNLRDAYAIGKVVDDRADWHPSTTQHGSAALDIRIDLNQGTLRPVNLLCGTHHDLPAL